MSADWPPAIDDRLRHLWACGHTFREIASRMRRPWWVVSARARKLGLVRRRALTTGEIRTLQHLRDQGWSLADIHRKTGRSKSMIRKYTT